MAQLKDPTKTNTIGFNTGETEKGAQSKSILGRELISQTTPIRINVTAAEVNADVKSASSSDSPLLSQRMFDGFY